MSRAPGTISRWLLATNLFLPSRCLWRSGRVILTSPSLFVLLSFCFCSVFVAKPGKTSSSSTFPLPPLMKPIWGEITKWNCQTHNRVNFLQYDICILIARDIFVHPGQLEKPSSVLHFCSIDIHGCVGSVIEGIVSSKWLLIAPPALGRPSLPQSRGRNSEEKSISKHDSPQFVADPSVNGTTDNLSHFYQKTVKIFSVLCLLTFAYWQLIFGNQLVFNMIKRFLASNGTDLVDLIKEIAL